MRAMCLIKEGPPYRRSAFLAGLQAAGYTVCVHIPKPGPNDVLVIWNRFGTSAAEAERFEKAGAMVIVAENGYLGTDFAGSQWYALALSHHNGVGSFPVGGPERWASMGVELQPWRDRGSEIVMLPQRGIGEPGIAMPSAWRGRIESMLMGLGYRVRVRPHPGKDPARPLIDDLTNADAVVTWGSGAALKALALGIPCYYGLRGWIGSRASNRLEYLQQGIDRKDHRMCDNEARLKMFEHLAWAMSPIEEIENGKAFVRLTGRAVRSGVLQAETGPHANSGQSDLRG